MPICFIARRHWLLLKRMPVTFSMRETAARMVGKEASSRAMSSEIRFSWLVSLIATTRGLR
jgi:hypothetical protein